MREVVAPPMRRGCLKPLFCISLATSTISSRDGVIRPLSPMMSALHSLAALRILSRGHMTPMSTTLKLLHARTTPTMFFPMSCTSPLTVASKTVPALVLVFPEAFFSSSMKGMRCATAFFITRADLMTWGKNIFPAPNRSPTVDIPSISGPSMTSRGLGNSFRHSSVSSTIHFVMPLMSAYVSLSFTGFFLHSAASFFFPPPLFVLFSLSFSAKSSRACVALLCLLRMASSRSLSMAGSMSV
mmetsp:Transcript_12667/g.22985  ORF Transcript_12667/g.22985 Transcript_12667/m.22985 type:complete len:242 (-) Transcript_12667:1932-2657(-)